MRSRKQKKKELSEEQLEVIDIKNFFDRIAPGIIRFYTDHYICGNSFFCVWAVTEYPPSTEETATCSPCGQERCNAPYLQPTCYKHGAKEDRSAGNEEKSYDDDCK